MKLSQITSATIVLSLTALVASATGSAGAAQPPPLVEQKALAILQATSAKVASAQTLSFTAIELFESMSRQRHPLAYTTKYEVTMQRPNKLRVDMLGDGPISDFLYDGTSMTAYAPGENMVATTSAPATIDAALGAIYHKAAIYFPFTDVIVTNPYGDIAGAVKTAYYVGQSKVIGGTTTDIVTVVANGVFEEVWIGADDKLPRMIRAVYLNDPDRKRHELVFSDWKLDSALAADIFTLPVPANAIKITFADPEAWPPKQ